ncbi:MAG: tetratricopeptide repeat protein, partial [Candidatus Latescibacterota bacterium]
MISKISCMIGLMVLLSLPAGSLPGEREQKAIALFEGGDLVAAKTTFETIREADGHNHTALYYLGRIALAEDELDNAIDLFRQAVKLDETSSLY